MYYKELYVFNKNIPVPATIRNYEEKDFTDLICIQKESFPHPFPEELWWNTEQLKNHISLFPEGALSIEVDGKLAGSMTALLVDFDINEPNHTWEEITDSGYIKNHNQNGNTLYVVDICVSPGYRKLGLGKWLMLSMYDIVIKNNLERLLGGSRMPGYYRYENVMTPEQYIQSVVNGHINDSVISFLLRCGRIPIHVAPNYLQDEESCNYGVLMEWKNPFIQK